MSSIWFTSDQHFGHANIIEYCKRPFKDVAEMNSAIIERYRDVVQEDHIVYFLGDVFFVTKDIARQIMTELPGAKHLIMGNHDRWTPSFYKSLGFETVHKAQPVNLDVGRTAILLSHRPTPVQGSDDFPLLSFCGHVHDLWLRQDGILNVGVDVHNFTPISLTRAMELSVVLDPT